MSDRIVLEAFDRAITTEAHNLARWPNLTWQQLHNRLQWEEEPLPPVVEEAKRRLGGTSHPWIRTRTPFRESFALLRTLEGHRNFANACAVAADGSFIVSASGDGTLKLWDPGTGRELRTLEARGGVWACAVAPDGSFIVSGNADGTLKLWDPETGRELRTLAGHAGGSASARSAPTDRSSSREAVTTR